MMQLIMSHLIRIHIHFALQSLNYIGKSLDETMFEKQT